jgi:hypothetical protein
MGLGPGLFFLSAESSEYSDNKFDVWSLDCEIVPLPFRVCYVIYV